MHIRTLPGRDPKTKQLKMKGYPHIPHTEQLHSKATKSFLPISLLHLLPPRADRAESAQDTEERLSCTREWPAGHHCRDAALSSGCSMHFRPCHTGTSELVPDEATATQHCPSTAHRPLPGSKRTLSPLCKHTTANCGSLTLELQRWANLRNSVA